MRIENLLPKGLVKYEDADRLQRDIWSRVHDGRQDNTLILAQFQPVYTAGRNTHEDDLVDKDLPVIRTDRGGSITWHGPGQLVIYPVVRLREPVDLVAYIRAVEAAVLKAIRDTWDLDVQTIEGRAGVWLRYHDSSEVAVSERYPDSVVALDVPHQDRKICAIGLKVVQGTTLHGLALNLYPDFRSAFTGIIPCGLADASVTSLREEGIETDFETAASVLITELKNYLNPLVA